MKKQLFLTSSLVSQMLHPLAASADGASDGLRNRLNDFLLQDAQRAEAGAATYSYVVNGRLVGTVQIRKLRAPFKHMMMKADACTTRCENNPPPACTTRCEVNPPPAPAPLPPPPCTTRCEVSPTPPIPAPCTTRCEVSPAPTPAPVPAPKPSENFIKTYGYQIVFGNVAGVPQPDNKPPYYFARKIRETADATIYEVFQFSEISDSAQPKGAAYLEVNRTTGELRFSAWTHWN
jgi:hypothetical protein